LPTLMTLAQFNSKFAFAKQRGVFEIYDPSGRQIAPEKVNSGIYFLIHEKKIQKILIL